MGVSEFPDRGPRAVVTAGNRCPLDMIGGEDTTVGGTGGLGFYGYDVQRGVATGVNEFCGSDFAPRDDVCPSQSFDEIFYVNPNQPAIASYWAYAFAFGNGSSTVHLDPSLSLDPSWSYGGYGASDYTLYVSDGSSSPPAAFRFSSNVTRKKRKLGRRKWSGCSRNTPMRSGKCICASWRPTRKS